MKLILAGCEYAGTTTLAHAIDDWLERTMGARLTLIHDHWKIPHTSGHPPDLSEEGQAQVLALSPELKEMTQRHSLYYHVQANTWKAADYMSIGLHIEDTVYAPLYFGYGGAGQPHDRAVVSRQVEGTILDFAPEMVLVLVKASPGVIARRMKESPHHNSPLRESDIEHVLERFEEEFARSFFRHKIVLDTGEKTVEQTVAEFASKIEPHLTDIDRSRILVHRAWS